MACGSRETYPVFLYPFLVIPLLWVFLFSGCGGGGGGSSYEVLPSKTLSWEAPTSYVDGTSLDPTAELDRFEVYVKESSTFSDSDQEMAAVSAIDRATNQITTSFDLANLSPFISKGIQYYVSIRVVAKNGLKSDFSPSVSFSY